MAESQSRYGIMEQLNSKKIEATKRLSTLEIELEQQKMAFDNTIHKIVTELSTSESSYENNHKNWLKNKEYSLGQKKAQFELDQKLAKQAHDRQIEDEERQIEEKKISYVEDHKAFVERKTAEQETNKTQFGKYQKMKELEKVSIEKEIQGYDEALKDLKEVSKDSTKSSD